MRRFGKPSIHVNHGIFVKASILIQIRRGSSRNWPGPLEAGVHQVSGDKSISQVEDQFREWHSRHLGAPDFLFGSSQEKFKHEKNRKLGLPGLKNLLHRKTKKKSDTRVSTLSEI